MVNLVEQERSLSTPPPTPHDLDLDCKTRLMHNETAERPANVDANGECASKPESEPATSTSDDSKARDTAGSDTAEMTPAEVCAHQCF